MWHPRTLASLLVILSTALAALPVRAADKFELRSPAFTDNGQLPADFTCDGSRASPPVEWLNPPAGTRSFAVTMHHVPAPGDTHVYWVVYNLPPSTTAIPRNDTTLGARGVNTVNARAEYTPPCSKGPGPKTYTLTVYALSSAADLKFPAPAVTMDALLDSIKDHTLATATMNVTYSRAAHGNEPRDDRRPAARQGGNDRPPPLDRAVDDLTLTPDQRAKADRVLEKYHQQRQQLDDDLLRQLKPILEPAQFEKLQAAPGDAPAVR